MVWKYIITNCRPTHGTVRKIHRIFTVTRHPKDNKSKETSPLFLVKMTAKLDGHKVIDTKYMHKVLFIHLSSSLLNITNSRYSQQDVLISFWMEDVDKDSLLLILS